MTNVALRCAATIHVSVIDDWLKRHTKQAQSKLPRPSGDGVKADARDAGHLARLLRLDEMSPKWRPRPCPEAPRTERVAAT